MVQIAKVEIRPYIELALRRKQWIIFSFIVCLLGGVVVLKVSPKIYQATTLILLEPQSIPDSYVKSTVSENLEGRLRTITQQIHSRTNLERIINDFRLSLQEENAATMAFEMIKEYIPAFNKDDLSQSAEQAEERIRMTALVEALSKSITVTMRNNAAFEISFAWHDPQIVAPVTNAIASRFIEENLNAREELAMGATDFLGQETAAIRIELEARERELEAFKRENMGMLPDQLDSNINILNQLRENLLNLERRLDQEKQQGLVLRTQTQMTRMERDSLTSAIRQQQGKTTSGRSGQGRSSEEFTSGSLEDLESELSRLRTIYTDKHPDVLALQRRIETLRREGGGFIQTHDENYTEHIPKQIALQLSQINTRMEAYQKEINEAERQIQIYKERVERTPQIEMAMGKILRDYQTVRQRYESILARKMDARMAEELEKKRKGEQFKILDPAVEPGKPFKPNPLKIMLAAIALGLGIGGGLAYLREITDPCFYNPEELEAYLDTKIIVSLPLEKFEDSSAKLRYVSRPSIIVTPGRNLNCNPKTMRRET